jgi:starvation-inducible DNA-binding protein
MRNIRLPHTLLALSAATLIALPVLAQPAPSASRPTSRPLPNKAGLQAAPKVEVPKSKEETRGSTPPGPVSGAATPGVSPQEPVKNDGTNTAATAPTSFNALRLNPIPNLPYNPERAGLPISERVPLDADARRRVSAELQGELADIIDLQLQTKQAHWNLVGPLYLSVHEQLGKFADRYAEYADRVAERALSLGYSVDGRPETVAGTTGLAPFPNGFVRDSEALDLISDRLDTIAMRSRARMNRVQDLDPPTENMLQEMIEGFEHDLWQMRVQKQ